MEGSKPVSSTPRELTTPRDWKGDEGVKIKDNELFQRFGWPAQGAPRVLRLSNHRHGNCILALDSLSTQTYIASTGAQENRRGSLLPVKTSHAYVRRPLGGMP